MSLLFLIGLYYSLLLCYISIESGFLFTVVEFAFYFGLAMTNEHYYDLCSATVL